MPGAANFVLAPFVAMPFVAFVASLLLAMPFVTSLSLPDLLPTLHPSILPEDMNISLVDCFMSGLSQLDRDNWSS